MQIIAADLGRALQKGRLYAQERLVVEQLRDLDRSKTDFLSTVSHELRTPLASITGYVELLRDGDAGPVAFEQVRMLKIIHRSAGRLRVLIEDLLTLSRIESGALRSENTPVEVNGLVGVALAMVRPSAEAAGVVLRDGVPAEPIVIAGDPGQLERVLSNLLSNTIKFSPQGGEVSVDARVEDLRTSTGCSPGSSGPGTPSTSRSKGPGWG